MTGIELVNALHASGTGETKLAPARKLCRDKKGAAPEDVLQVLASGGAPAGTLEKAKAIMQGKAKFDPALRVDPEDYRRRQRERS